MLSNRLFEIFERFPNIGALAFSENRVQSISILIEHVQKIWWWLNLRARVSQHI
jgi:hypothetical protein